MEKIARLATLALALMLISVARAGGLETLKGKTVPDFQLRDLNGKVHKFSQFRSKVVLLNFWSPYCSGCGMEVPLFNNWFRKYRKGGLVVIGLSSASPKEQREARGRLG